MSNRVLARAPHRAQVHLPALAACALTAGATVGWLLTPAADASLAATAAGEELTRLLRMMAGLKLLLVAAGAVLVLWRLRFPVRPGFAAAYLLALALAAAGPGLIWQMAHVGLGAAALHGGLALMLLLLWRDQGSPAMLGPRARALVRGRRAS